MSGPFGAAALFVLAGLWLALPFVPAFLEWRNKRDAKPLRVVQDHDGDVRHFAHRFRAYLGERLPAGPVLGDVSAETAELNDATPYIPVPSGGEPALAPHEWRSGRVPRLIVAHGDLWLPAPMAYLSEIYARGRVSGDEGIVCRAILTEQDVVLGAGSMVLRWLHADGSVAVGAGSVLYGRVSAEDAIRLGPDCRFERLHAPEVHFASSARPPDGEEIVRQPFELQRSSRAEVAARRWLVHGRLTIPKHSYFKGDLVVYGTLRIGEGCHIQGSVKSHRDLHVGADTRIDGSAVSNREIVLGDRCVLKGPILAERAVRIGAWCRVGKRTNRTTISAPRIVVGPGVVSHGTVWAREHGVMQCGVSRSG